MPAPSPLSSPFPHGMLNHPNSCCAGVQFPAVEQEASVGFHVVGWIQHTAREQMKRLSSSNADVELLSAKPEVQQNTVWLIDSVHPSDAPAGMLLYHLPSSHLRSVSVELQKKKRKSSYRSNSDCKSLTDRYYIQRDGSIRSNSQ